MRISHRVAVSGILTFHVVLVLLFFDPKVHVGGDDSDYIVASMDFLDGVAFPTWHGSLYPIFLSPFLSAFGVNVILFKVISVALGVFSLIFLCKAFYKKVPDRVLYFALSITGFSYTMVAYLSTTYSEPLFIFLQSLVVYFFSLLERPLSGARENRQYFITAALGLSAFLLSITRNVGLGVAIPFIIFFALEKRWRVHATFLAAFVFLHAVFLLLKKKVWGSGQLGIEGQLSRIALKNFYDPADGKEDVAGFAIRFWENSNLYLSKHLAALLGLRPSTAATVWPLLTVIFYCLFVVAAVIAYKKINSSFSCSCMSPCCSA